MGIGLHNPLPGGGPTRRPGFTIMELMVIVVIIAMLTALSVPSIVSIRRKAKRTLSLARLGMIDAACNLYETDFEQYPPSAPDPNLGWEGRHVLVQCLVGYQLDPNGVEFIDGKAGPGFRVVKRGKVYGPYNDTDKVPMTAGSDPRAFLDSFGNEIDYYRFDRNTRLYDSNDNTDGPDDPNHANPVSLYANSDPNADGTTVPYSFFRDGFILATPGPDRQWSAFVNDATTDDVTNFLKE